MDVGRAGFTVPGLPSRHAMLPQADAVIRAGSDAYIGSSERALRGNRFLGSGALYVCAARPTGSPAKGRAAGDLEAMASAWSVREREPPEEVRVTTVTRRTDRPCYPLARGCQVQPGSAWRTAIVAGASCPVRYACRRV